MARLVKTVEAQVITCKVITRFSDGTTSEKALKVDDVVEGLRYVEDEEVKTVTGRISAINVVCQKVTNVNVKNPVDYFAKDVVVKSIEVDASEPYVSKVVTVDAREIVEDAGVVNVVKVDVVSIPEITLQMTYTDGTVVNQDLVIGDILCDMSIMTNPGQADIVGDFKVAAFKYSTVSQNVVISGLYLAPLAGGYGIYAAFKNIIKFTEKAHADVTATDNLGELAAALEKDDEVFAFFDNDVTIPPRSDGNITTLMIGEGKKLTVDLNGHNLNTLAYAFYVNGGDLVIRDTTGNGVIDVGMPGVAYPAVQVNAGGTCTMESGTIDTTNVELKDGEYNWMYGVVCRGDGVFNMTGGKMKTADAAGISITNGTASGEGAQFNVSGNAVIESVDCTAIYLADNKSVNISGNAKIKGGILLRMGDLNVSENAVVDGFPAGSSIYPLGLLACESGCENHNAAILAMTGCYNSELGNDLNINISGNAKVNGYIDNAIDIATINTKYDQVVNVNVEKSSNVKFVDNLWNVYDHSALAAMATEQGKTLPAEKNTTTLTVKVDNATVYPVTD